MAEAQKSGEQSMDDILASIRKIISDEPASDPDSASATEGDGVQSVDMAASDGAALPGQGDDLSDLFEPSTPRANIGGDAGREASWPFNGAGDGVGTDEAEKPSNSLKNKLASLDVADSSASRLNSSGDASSAQAQSDASLQILAAKEVAISPTKEKAATASIDAGSESVEAAIDPNLAGMGKSPEPVLDEVTEIGAPVATEAAKEPAPTREEGPASKVQSIEQPRAKPTVTVEPGKTEGDMGGETGIGEASISQIADVAKDAPIAADGVADVDGDAASSDKTLEAVVNAALQPMLKEWLDANLPRLVQDKLKVEIERAVRDGRLSGQ